MERKKISLQPSSCVDWRGRAHSGERIFDKAREVMRMPGVINENAGVCMKWGDTVNQHTGTSVRQWIERFGFEWHGLLARGESPVPTAKGDADRPGQECIGAGRGDGRVFVIFVVSRLVVFRAILCTCGFAIGGRKRKEIESDCVDFSLNVGEFARDGGWIEVAKAGTQECGEQEGMRGFFGRTNGTFQRPSTAGKRSKP